MRFASHLRRTMFCILTLLCLLGCTCTAAAASQGITPDSLLSMLPDQDWPAAPILDSHGAIVLEVQTGTVLYAKNAVEAQFPASTTKLLTGLLAAERCATEETVTVSRQAILALTPGSSHIGLKAGEQLTVLQCLYGLLLPSANEVANALAEHISGSIPSFVQLMNQRAAELGCVNTHFSNANGLHEADHYTCPYDLAIIYAACAQNSTFMSVNGASSYVLPATNLIDQTRPMSTTHQMMRKGSEWYDARVLGGKTGSTPEAGRCLVTYAKDHGMEIIVVTMGAEHPGQYTDTEKLLNYAFSHFSCVRPSDSQTSSSNTVSDASPLKQVSSTQGFFHMDESTLVLLPDTLQFSQLQAEASYQSQNNGILGTLTYTWKGYPLGTVLLINASHNSQELIYREADDSAWTPLQKVRENGQRLIIIRFWVLAAVLLGIIVLGAGIFLLHRFFSPRFRNTRRRQKQRKLHF